MWIIFQPNALVDVAPTRDGFKENLEKMKEELKIKNFHIPAFSSNFRNSAAISNVECDAERGRMWRMKSSISPLTPLRSRLPGDIPKLSMK